MYNNIEENLTEHKASAKDQGLYRKCVGIIVHDQSSNLYLVGKRAGVEKGWQFPQGGVEDGESNIQAARNELFEEMGVRACGIEPRVNKDRDFSVGVCCVADVKQAMRDYSHNSQPSYLPVAQFVKSTGPYKYDYPAYVKRAQKGQEQVWFLAKKIAPINVVLNYEFSDYAWMRIEEILGSIVEFKKAVYQAVVKDLKLL